jgi:hypothetical protein
MSIKRNEFSKMVTFVQITIRWFGKIEYFVKDEEATG